ncbi:MAG: hypothetical protein JSW27_17360, partial [Phycisphaerales bacterium]
MAGVKKTPKLRYDGRYYVANFYKPDGKRSMVSFGPKGEHTEGEDGEGRRRPEDVHPEPRSDDRREGEGWVAGGAARRGARAGAAPPPGGPPARPPPPPPARPPPGPPTPA